MSGLNSTRIPWAAACDAVRWDVDKRPRFCYTVLGLERRLEPQTQIFHTFGVDRKALVVGRLSKQECGFHSQGFLVGGANMAEWRVVPGFPSYEVSDEGQVRSFKQKRKCDPVPLVISPIVPPDGHGYVFLYEGLGIKRHANGMGRGKKRYVHRLVLEAFVGPCPLSNECRHLDGNAGNNRLENLAWGTRCQNLEDQRRHGRHAVGVCVHTHKLSPDDVLRIRKLYGTMSDSALGRLFGVNSHQIKNIGEGRAWRHI